MSALVVTEHRKHYYFFFCYCLDLQHYTFDDCLEDLSKAFEPVTSNHCDILSPLGPKHLQNFTN